MAVYLGILATSSVFSFCYSKARDKSAQVMFVVLCFLSLFVPAAVRYGIGGDYFNYVRIYRQIGNGHTVNAEPCFRLIVKLLNVFAFHYHWLFVVYSFLTVLFVFLSIKRKYFLFGIPAFVMVFYVGSYSAIRQYLACAIVLYAYTLFFEKKYLKCAFWSIIAVLNHTSVFVAVLILLLYRFVPNYKAFQRIFTFLFFTILCYLLRGTIKSLIFSVLLPLTPYAKYANGIYSLVGTDQGGGLGFFLKLICFVVFAYLIDGTVLPKREYKICLAILFGLILSTCLMTTLYIFARVVNGLGQFYIFLFIAASKSHIKYKNLLFGFLCLSFFLLFFKDVMDSKIVPYLTASGKQITPYLTLWSYKNNLIISLRKIAFGV